MLYSRCQTHSLLATIAATTLVQATTISPALLSCLSTQLCPSAFSHPSEGSSHSCWHTPLLRITESLSIPLRIKFTIFTLALRALHHLVPVCLLHLVPAAI